MTSMGFCRLVFDSCAFRRGTTWPLLYNDDTLAAREKDSGRQVAEEELGRHLVVQGLGKLRSFLWVLLSRKAGRALLSQHSYLKRTLSLSGVKSCKSATTLKSVGAFQTFEKECNLALSKRLYQKLLCFLLSFFPRSPPNISVAVSVYFRYASGPCQAHQVSLKRVRRYLKGAIDYGLSSECSEDAVLSRFCDADRASDRSDRRSTTESAFFGGKSQ